MSSKDEIRIGGIAVPYLVEGHEANHTVAMFEFDVAPGSKVPGPHRHDGYEEIAYGLEGILTFTVEGKVTEVGPGRVLVIPRGAVHRFDTFIPPPQRCSPSLPPRYPWPQLLPRSRQPSTRLGRWPARPRVSRPDYAPARLNAGHSKNEKRKADIPFIWAKSLVKKGIKPHRADTSSRSRYLCSRESSADKWSERCCSPRPASQRLGLPPHGTLWGCVACHPSERIDRTRLDLVTLRASRDVYRIRSPLCQGVEHWMRHLCKPSLLGEPVRSRTGVCKFQEKFHAVITCWHGFQRPLRDELVEPCSRLTLELRRVLILNRYDLSRARHLISKIRHGMPETFYRLHLHCFCS
jgi:hypothetical protein